MADIIGRLAKQRDLYKLRPVVYNEFQRMINEGSALLQTFAARMDTESMRDLVGWWTRAEHMLMKFEGSLVPPPTRPMSLKAA